MIFGCDNTNAPRCFLSPGGLTMAVSQVLRLVCQAANNKFPFSVCFNHKSMFSVLDRLKINLNQVAVYSSGGLQWREVEGGELPSPRNYLRAAMVGDVLHVTGGRDDGTFLMILGSVSHPASADLLVLCFKLFENLSREIFQSCNDEDGQNKAPR